jgi:micrococcal nuclease
MKFINSFSSSLLRAAKLVGFCFMLSSIFSGVSATILSDFLEPFHAHVKEVVNGSLIKVRRSHKGRFEEFYVRLYATDAPAPVTIDGRKQDYSQESREYLSELILGKTVFVLPQKVDVYNVVNSFVFLDDENVNIKMVREGLAWVYKYLNTIEQDKSVVYDPDSPKNGLSPSLGEIYREMYDAENEAMRKKLNVWSIKDPLTPFQFRNLSISTAFRKPRMQEKNGL